jgi:hypothetical protein
MLSSFFAKDSVIVEVPVSNPDGTKKLDDKRLEKGLVVAHRLMRGMGRGANKPIRMKTWFSVDIKTTAGTDYATPLSVLLSSFAELTTASTLWDEVKFESGTLMWSYTIATVNQTGVQSGIWVYDPADPGVLSTLTNGLPFPCKSLAVLPVITSSSSPIPVNSSGYHTMQFRALTRGLHFTSNGNPVGGWASILTSGLDFGYLKPYFQFQSSAGAATIRCHVGITCQLRQRT